MNKKVTNTWTPKYIVCACIAYVLWRNITSRIDTSYTAYQKKQTPVTCKQMPQSPLIKVASKACPFVLVYLVQDFLWWTDDIWTSNFLAGLQQDKITFNIYRMFNLLCNMCTSFKLCYGTSLRMQISPPLKKRMST